MLKPLSYTITQKPNHEYLFQHYPLGHTESIRTEIGILTANGRIHNTLFFDDNYFYASETHSHNIFTKTFNLLEKIRGLCEFHIYTSRY